KWQSLFDPEGTGKITFRRFCDVLGVHPERPQAVISKPLYGIPTTGLRPEIFVIMQELPLQDQIKISEEAYRLTQPQDKFIEKEASEKLKRWLDTTYGRHWHVTIVRGSYWTTYTHIPNWSFHFKINQHSFIIYLDLDHDEKISMKDLKNYVETYNLDEKMIESWRKLFDPNRTGYITLAKFCDVLGVKMEEARKVREEIKRRSTNILPSDVYVIAQQMSITDQIQISDQARRLLFPPNELDNKEIAHSLKLWLHKVYGPIWHVVRWQALFDPTNTGIITFQKFCDVLGVKPEQARTLRKSVVNNRPLPKDLQIISQNMSPEDQFQIFEFVRSLLDKNLSGQDMTQMIKQWLDKTFDPSWHVVIIDGSYWISYSHLPEQSLQFRLKEKCYLVWRTPKY
ncbi:unnamed protein product, partial [Schistosoma mattheei]